MNKNLLPTNAVAVVLILLVGACAGCETAPAPGNRASSSTANSNETVPPSAKPELSRKLVPASQPVTLPLLDAFFAQEGFDKDLKTKLQLTDEQVNHLKTIARQGTSKLREGVQDESTGRSAAAREDAYEKMRAAIGEEKTGALIAFVSERWSGDNPPVAPPSGATPSASGPPAAVPSDRRIIVNAPAFRMDLFEDGKLIKSYKIGIGYPEFPLPTGLRKAETIIFNPTWTPPDEPWVESPGSKVKIGEKVEAGDKLNPLGPIKIPIGLPSLIHGGKAPSKLGGFASHGCVGLTNSQIEDFARRLARLSGTQITDDQIAEYEKKKTETKPVKLANPVPVELRYDTITVEDGSLHIYRDVYDRGTNTEENLRNVLQSYGVPIERLSDSERAELMRALGQMARDATGRPATEPAVANANLAARSSSAKSGNNARAGSPSNRTSGKVTRTIRGEKAEILEIPALVGKGYPAPVDLDAGVAPKKVMTKTSRKRR